MNADENQFRSADYTDYADFDFGDGPSGESLEIGLS
jgi:hypothetical protein